MEHFVEALFDLAPRKSARDSIASAGGTHVLQKSAGRRGDAQAADEWPITLQRRRPLTRAQSHSRQNDVALVIGDEKHGTIRGWSVLQRRPVGDESARQIGRNQRPEITLHDSLRRFGQVAGVESRSQLA
jgi:hypothetical protein